MYTQTQNLNKKHSPGAIIVTAVIAAGLITVQHMVVSVHDNNATQPVYADVDSQGSIVVFDTISPSYSMTGDDLLSQPSWLDSIRESIGSLRQEMMSFIPNQMPISPSEMPNNILSLSGSQTTGTIALSDTFSESRSVQCEQTFPVDGTGHSKSSLISRALDHCLIEANDDNKVLPDAILTHDMMLIIADRAGFDVDLNRGSSKAVTRDDLKRFLDYLLASKQIDGVPAQRYNDILTRIEYLTVLRDIIPVSQVLPEATVVSVIVPTSTVAPIQQASAMTVADFKRQINTKLATPLIIMSYDATVIATPEIQQSILLDVINGGSVLSNAHGSAPSSHPSQGPIVENQSGIGVNKEMLKTLLGGLVENL